MSVATKISLGFVAILSGFALLGLLSVMQISVADDLQALKDSHLALARLVAQLKVHQENRIRDLGQGLQEPDPKSQELALQIAKAYFPGTIRSVIEDIQGLLDAQGTNADAFYQGVQKRTVRIAQLNEGLDALTVTVMTEERTPEHTAEAVLRLRELESSLKIETFELNKAVGDEIERTVRKAQRSEQAAIWRVIWMTGLGLLLGLPLTFLLTARGLAPIKRLVVYARAISRGDYAQTVGPIGDEQLASLADELTQMARARQEREAELDRQADELERAYRRVEELKRYQESIVRSLRTAVVVTDRELKVTSTNPAAETVFGLLADRVRLRPLAELPVGQVLLERVGSVEDLIHRTEPTNLRSVPLGSLLVDITVAPLENERGERLGLVMAVEDVTDAVQTKEALIRSERLAAIGRMSAHVTHEIRNPLSSIGLNAELLADMSVKVLGAGAEAEEVRTLCRAIVKEVDRLSAITDEYLRFARLPRPELRESNVRDLLLTIGAFMKPDLAAARVGLELRIAEGLPNIALDSDQLRQALLNLVRNAKESMPQGGQVILGAELDGEGLAIYVRDTGVGIAEGHLERIFDPFYSTKMTGTGLGLTLTQQIVGEHGGALKVQSSPGAGSEFRINLPMTQPIQTKGIFDSEGAPIRPFS